MTSKSVELPAQELDRAPRFGLLGVLTSGKEPGGNNVRHLLGELGVGIAISDLDDAGLTGCLGDLN